MNQIRRGRHVWQQDAPILFGQIKGKLFAGETTVTLGDTNYSVIKDKDERSDFYVLTLKS
ncbi:MAG: hypothetical protein AVDCRST_MAG93-8439 [uncultured Chloroflexia bacterium]|uniref:Uncharacterized protein n=1 Tax=uncultured Chloroflexia bacterium TaxID=1672391 RepID=A0A6J4MZW7_9CHLR|nr:MAG: hypothetical protein AVDCRST_MAG93-8439 [uncultured Chloroflexia bacterium]